MSGMILGLENHAVEVPGGKEADGPEKEATAAIPAIVHPALAAVHDHRLRLARPRRNDASDLATPQRN